MLYSITEHCIDVALLKLPLIGSTLQSVWVDYLGLIAMRPNTLLEKCNPFTRLALA
jgi:hypothetical protein